MLEARWFRDGAFLCTAPFPPSSASWDDHLPARRSSPPPPFTLERQPSSRPVKRTRDCGCVSASECFGVVDRRGGEERSWADRHVREKPGTWLRTSCHHPPSALCLIFLLPCLVHAPSRFGTGAHLTCEGTGQAERERGGGAEASIRVPARSTRGCLVLDGGWSSGGGLGFSRGV